MGVLSFIAVRRSGLAFLNIPRPNEVRFLIANFCFVAFDERVSAVFQKQSLRCASV